MKRQKKLIYILGPFVIVIWGIAIHRIVAATNLGEDDVIISKNNKAYPKIRIPMIQPDTFHLLLNYPDPFTPELDNTQRTDITHLPVLKPEVKPTAAVKYMGYIWNPVSKKMIAIINQDGKDRMTGQGENFNQIRIIEITKEYVKIGYKGGTDIIKLNK